MQQGQSTISRGAWRLLFAMVLSGICSTAAWAQFRASIQGVVTDAQGAAVVGATVKLTSKETNRTQEIKSGDEGFYRFDRLAPGGYSMTTEMKGFKKKLLENVQVEAEESQGVNIQLETATTDTRDEKLYLADSTENSIIIIDAKTHNFEKVKNVGLFPWGTHIMDSKDNYCH